MQIKIRKAFWLAAEKELKKLHPDLASTSWHYREAETIRCDELSVAAMEGLIDVAKKHTNVTGCRAIVRDLGLWLALRKDAKAARKFKASTLQNLFHLLIAYIKANKRRHLYKALKDDPEVVLSYYVDTIKYEEPRRDEAPYICMRLLYTVLGKTEHINVYFHGDCLHQPVYEILGDKGYYLETPQLRADYEFYLDRFNALYEQIGLQCLASGPADDEDIDGNNDDDDYYSWYHNNYNMDANGEPTRVLVDIPRESDKSRSGSRDGNAEIHYTFWHNKFIEAAEDCDEDDTITEEELAEHPPIEIPVHPYVVCFDLRRHCRLKVHANNLKPYEYNTKIRDRLVLPQHHAALIDTLLADRDVHFRDLIVGKAGGTIILAQGAPGTGKTLTAEIYAETMKRPLYTVQCSQLGVDSKTLEANLIKVLSRSRRWNAVLLLDEADVYIHRRGDDLIQNAIVGVFLRVLEYQVGVLFLTTNRGDLVDDAILSRCTVRLSYSVPSVEDQAKIWQTMAAANELHLNAATIQEIVKRFDKLSGRDIKNLLKLAMVVASDRKLPIDHELIGMVKEFKPTYDGYEQDAREAPTAR